MNITYNDIMHRKSELALDRPSNAPDGIYYMYENVLNKQYSFQDARTVIRNWRTLSEDTRKSARYIRGCYHS